MKPPWQVALGLLFLVLPNLSGDTEPNPGEGRSRWEGGWGGILLTSLLCSPWA